MSGANAGLARNIDRADETGLGFRLGLRTISRGTEPMGTQSVEVVTIVTGQGIAVAAMMKKVGLALQRLYPVEFLMVLVTLETI